MAVRWEGDNRGEGVADAARLVSGADELVGAFGRPAWVTEQPELHLLPHIEDWCQRDRRLDLIRAHTDGANAYVLDFHWHRPTGTLGEARAAVFCLIGAFAESATYVRQRSVDGEPDEAPTKLQFEVGTGELASDSGFEPHGHVVIINVLGVR